MAIRKPFALIAQKLQEAADTELTASDLCRWLSDACREIEGYACYIDHIGDSESGDVIYSCQGDIQRAPYEIRQVNGKWTATIDTDNAIDVLPRTTYEPEADDVDHYASMESAGFYQPGAAQIIERFISKDERNAADAGSFAGKGKSFPILKPGDVQAAVSSMGRAGPGNHSTATLKKNIIAIAKKKGWTKYLPKAWQDGEDDSKEAADLEITGDVIPLREGAVGQDGTAYLKLIAPGWGSSGYYSADVLKRDGPKVFGEGTKNFWDHQTESQEAERPEGSLRDLASVLTEDAHYDEKGPAGPGLYAKAKVFEQFRQPVDDLAKHIGMSIRALGKAKEGKAEGRTGAIIEGLTKGLSVDYVTTPGAGGKVLQLFEAARGAASITDVKEGDRMDAESKKLLEGMSRRLAIAEAREAVDRKLATIALPPEWKAQLRESLPKLASINEAGDFDSKAFDTLMEAKLHEEGDRLKAITGSPVHGLGPAPDPKVTEAERKTAAKEHKRTLKEMATRMGLTTKAGRKIFREGRAAFNPAYNARELTGAGVGAEE